MGPSRAIVLEVLPPLDFICLPSRNVDHKLLPSLPQTPTLSTSNSCNRYNTRTTNVHNYQILAHYQSHFHVDHIAIEHHHCNKFEDNLSKHI